MWLWSVCRTLGSKLLVALALLLIPGVAAAEPILFTDREAFLAAASPDTLIAFDEPTFGVFELIRIETPLGPTSFPQVRFDLGDVQVVYPEPSQNLIPNPLVEVLPTGFVVTVRLPANTYAVGVDLLQASAAGLQIRFSNGVEWSHSYADPGCSIFDGTPPCEPFTGFVGVVADPSTSISSFTAGASPPGFLSGQPRPYPAVLDNLLIQVPEPGTALLVGAGVVSVYWRRRALRYSWVKLLVESRGSPLFAPQQYT